ncbi:MAG: tRNA pseudouridine(13) synthase TruD [Xanthomonadaceae bacterium]|nr:tRNA pseudouridine(13) synthase TruD [Xanthomonadaceae bacterium]
MSVDALARAHGAPVLAARLRVTQEDFRVDEIDAFEASGCGEHLLLAVEKRGMTTPQAARLIAQWAGVAESAIGYAGLKDRHAVTRQRFSVWIPKKISPDVATLQSDDLQVLAADWHARKLPRGALSGNRFVLVLRDVEGDRDAIDARLQAIATRGVPNYFGEQRFGRGGDNVAQALAMFAGRRVRREERSLLLSAARSQIFNDVLGQRVARGDWDTGIEGDVFMLDGSHSVFGPVGIDEAIGARIAGFDIHPTGPMWGRGELRTQGEVQALEGDIANAHAELCKGLEGAGMKQERRGLRLPVAGLAWEWPEDRALRVSFNLPAGSYATTVLRELGDVVDMQRG